MKSNILIESFITFILLFFNSAIAQIQIGQDIEGIGAEVHCGQSVSMPDPITLAVGSPSSGYYGYSEYGAIVYQLSGNQWIQFGNGIGESTNSGEGSSVCMPNSKILAIGAPGHQSHHGRVQIYFWNDSLWTQKGEDIVGEASGDFSGQAISMPDENTIAIGAVRNDGTAEYAGHARVFEWNGTNWIQKGEDIDGEAYYDWMGYSVSMPNSNTLAVSAPKHESFQGHIKIFDWNGTAWQIRGIAIENPGYSGGFGNSIHMPDLNTIAVGAPTSHINETWAGTVRIYSWNGIEWTQKGTDIHGEHYGVGAGYTVFMPDSNQIVFGESGNNSAEYNYDENYSGRVRIFHWNGEDWQYHLEILGEDPAEHFGRTIHMPNNSFIAVGVPSNSQNGFQSGHARVFKLCNDIPDTSLAINGSSIISNAEELNYQWIDCNNNEPIDGENAQLFNPSSTGTYAVLIIDGECSYMSECIDLSVVSIGDLGYKILPSLYPNPNNGQFAIELDEVLDDFEIRIKDLTGTTIFTSKYSNKRVLDFNLNLASGVFVLEVHEKKAHYSTLFVIK